MSYMVFDTETTGLDKPFCYDIGYAIFDDNRKILTRKHFVVEQIWHNLPLFESAYYKDKRQQYVSLMRQHKATMNKFGYIMREISRDIYNYKVTDAYAYNSSFDDKVIEFNCNWFKCNNPFEQTPIHDIWGYACQYITNTQPYKNFCEKYELFTDTGNYKQSAEAVYRFITSDSDFNEAHMGLYDVDIEAIILHCCEDNGATPATDYKVNTVLPRPRITPYVVKVNGTVIHEGAYFKKSVRNDVYNFFEM